MESGARPHLRSVPRREDDAGLRVRGRLTVAEARAFCGAARGVLEVYGNQVVCAEDGATAVELAERWAPDVAIVDIGLPDIDGYELARRLRAP
ncbi:MAG: response regulator [Candidatus Rokubacteria bacterium]|nr:response regulator [Candidatus Rokubacteria bacterium]